MNGARAETHFSLSTSEQIKATPTVEMRTSVFVLSVLALVVLPRLFVFSFNENLYGDAVARTELALRWVEAPHWIESYSDGAMQFGPLHIYLVGMALKLGVPPVDAGRWVSLFFGIMGAWPLWALTRRYFSARSGLWALGAYGLWGMHLQMSTTAGSEAVSLFFVLWALALFAPGIEERNFSSLAVSGLILNFACALRYDNWLLIPVLVGVLLFFGTGWVAKISLALLFGFMTLPFPMVWMQGNELAHGNPFWPVKTIEQFHESWFLASAGSWGQVPYRLWNLVFWPGAALLTLSPLLAFWGFLGMRHAWRTRPEMRWLVCVALIPAGYFTFKSVVLGNFSPLARFTVTQVALVVPFLRMGYETWAQSKAEKTRRFGVALAWVLAVAFPVALGVFTFRKEGRLQDALRPVSPVSTNPVALMATAKEVGARVPKGAIVVVDASPKYFDLQLAFFSGLKEEQLLRYRWGDLSKRLETVVPSYLVLLPESGLVKDSAVFVDGSSVRMGSWQFVREFETEGFGLYRRLD